MEDVTLLSGRALTPVLLGVQGGTLSEGMDYKGKEMEMVINLGLPYPSSGLEMALKDMRRDYFVMCDQVSGKTRDRVERAEDLAYKQEAFRKLAQSSGRAHRGFIDKAVVIFVDERLLAVKRLQENGQSIYEYMSAPNAAKNRDILQPPLRRIYKNIVIDSKSLAEAKSLMDYISRETNAGEGDFIDFETMGRTIREAYRKWEI